MTGLFASATVSLGDALGGAGIAIVILGALSLSYCEWKRLQDMKRRVKKAQEQVEKLKHKKAA